MELQVSVRWGDRLIDVRQLSHGVPAIAGASLVRSGEDGARVTVPARADVTLFSGAGFKTREQLVSEGKLQPGELDGNVLELGHADRAEVRYEGLAYEVRYVESATKVKAAATDERDFRFFKIASIAMLGFFAAVAAMQLTPRDEGLSDDLFGHPTDVVKMLPVAPVVAPKLELEGAKLKGEVGKLGKLDATQEEAERSKVRSPIVRGDARDLEVKKAGLLGALDSLNGKASNDVLSGGGLGGGVNTALNGLKNGGNLGDARGMGGWDARGTGPGAGGNGLSLGDGLIGNGGGPRRGQGGLPTANLRRPGGVMPPTGPTTLTGGLPRDVILKVVQRHMSEIKFCYESELQKSPDLFGKVAVLWVIGPTGEIIEADVAESSLENAGVEACMLRSVRRWKFPEPQGGGVVTVTFPWVFKAAGSDSEE